MAKKAKTEGVLARAERLKADGEAAAAIEREAEAVAKAAVEADQATVIPPKSTPVGSGRKRAAIAAKAESVVKKVRYQREKKEERTGELPATLPTRSTTASEKMLTKNVKAAPKGEATPNRGPKRPRAKP